MTVSFAENSKNLLLKDIAGFSPLTQNALDDNSVSLNKFLTSYDLSSNSNSDPSLCMKHFFLSRSEL